MQLQHLNNGPLKAQGHRLKKAACAPAAGIVQGQGEVVRVHQQQHFKSISIRFPAGKVDGIQIGASVAINGTCLTVAAPALSALLCPPLK